MNVAQGQEEDVIAHTLAWYLAGGVFIALGLLGLWLLLRPILADLLEQYLGSKHRLRNRRFPDVAQGEEVPGE